MDTIRNLEPSDPSLPVLVPGDPEEAATAKCKKDGYITYTPDHIVAYRTLAAELGVQPMKPWQGKD